MFATFVAAPANQLAFAALPSRPAPGSADAYSPGRVVLRRRVVEMAQTLDRKMAVNGRARDPTRDRQRACPRSAEIPLRGSVSEPRTARVFAFCKDPPAGDP